MPPNPLLAPKAAPGQVVGVLPNSDLAVGSNPRFQRAVQRLYGSIRDG